MNVDARRSVDLTGARSLVDRTQALVLAQVLLFLTGFALLIGFHVFVTREVDALDARHKNEQSRILLAEQIQNNLISLEGAFFALAMTKAENRQKVIKRNADINVREIREILQVLEHGGVYTRDEDVNLEFQENLHSEISYVKYQNHSKFVLISIDLLPKLERAEQQIAELLKLKAWERGTSINLDQVRPRIRKLLRKIPPLFIRMRENTARIHSNSLAEFKSIERALKQERQQYAWLEVLVTATTMVLVVGLAMAIGRRIRRTNQLLQQANVEMEQLKNEAEEAERHNAVLNSILELSLKDQPLQATLDEALSKLLSVPWLSMETEGSVFLVDGEHENLILAAGHRLSPELQHKCASVKFGECLCGTAAQNEEVVFVSDEDASHDIPFKDITTHGHVCLPIMSGGVLLGVLNLYVSAESRRKDVNIDFLQIVTKTLATIIERAQTEETLRKVSQAVEQSSATVVITDLDGVIEYVNPMFTVKTGYSREEAIGAHTRLVKSGLTPDHVYKELWEALKQGETWSGEFQTRNKSGHIFWESAVISAVRNSQGVPTHYIAVKEDISERKRMEKELVDASIVAERATQAKSDFLANMSHEIRTPMNAIIGFSELLLSSGEMERRQHQTVGKIHNAAVTLLRIINDILDFSKIEAGKLELEHTPFSLCSVMEQLNTLISAKAQSKGLELLFDRHMDVPEHLIGDPLRLGQVLTNLVSNAVKFTESGEVVVSIRRKATDKPRSDKHIILEFMVRDTGIGMSQAQQNRLFQSFSQADTSITRKYGGTGLGLSISRNFVEMMGGDIRVQSAPGMGSTFIFTVDLEEEETSRPDFCPLTSLRGKRVLVVDDSLTSRDIFRKWLTEFGLAVVGVGDGEEALEILSQSAPFDVVIVDRFMPGMDGVTLCQKIVETQEGQSKPRLILTSTNTQEDVPPGLDALGITTFLPKPFTPSNLFDSISSAFGRDVASLDSSSTVYQPSRETLQVLRNARVLLVEDNEINRQLAVELLRNAQIRVDTAGNGQEALDKIRAQAADYYDCVLMDAQMPVMGGYEATRILRRDPAYAALPILAMTANVLDADKSKAAGAGMNDHIAKPINIKKLYATLQKWIQPSGAGVHEDHEDAPAHAVDGVMDDVVQVTARTEPDIPQIPGLDTRRGLQHANNDPALYRKLLLKFTQSHRGVARSLDAAIAADDMETACRLVHTTKGLAATVGAMVLADKAAALETVLKTQMAEEYKAQSTAFIRELDAIVSAVASVVQDDAGGVTHAGASHADILVPDELMPLLDRLLRLLQAYDSEAEDALDEVSKAAGPTILPHLSLLQRKVSSYEYDEAAEILSGMMSRFYVDPASEKGVPL